MRDTVIIGSTAIKHHFPDFNRIPKDLDIAVLNEHEYKGKSNPGLEYLYNPVICKYTNSDYLEPNLLLTLKLSHAFWNIKWEKHVFDIQFLLSKGCVYDIDILNELRQFWDNYLPKIRRSNLNMTKEDFFTNAVNENVNQHDIYHTYITDIPMYTKILKDGCEVEVSEEKFNLLSHEDKLKIITEECSVMAYERYRNDLPYYIAYRKQLKDCLIKHFPQFVALYGLTHFKDLAKYKIDYYTLIDNGIKQNKNK